MTRVYRQFIRFSVVGASSAAITVALYSGLVVAGLPYPLAALFAYSLGIANGYTWHRRWTFGAGAHRHAMAARYLLVALLGLGITEAILAAMIELGGTSKLVAQAVAIPASALATFVGNRHWTFREHALETQRVPARSTVRA
jgi:putative flippase GtrA